MAEEQCSACGAVVDLEDAFCRHCGAPASASPVSIGGQEIAAVEDPVKPWAFSQKKRGQDNSMAVAGAIIFFIGFLVALFYQASVGILVLVTGLALWIIGAARRNQK